MADDDAMTECPVCLKTYDESEARMPRLLPCTHTMCHTCLGSLIQGNKLVCLECSAEHHAANGAQTFFQNRYILRLLKSKIMVHIQKAPVSLQMVMPSNLLNFNECKRHDRLLSLYCKEPTCRMKLCQIGMIEDHKGHEVVDVIVERNAQVKEMQVLTKKIEDFERELTASFRTLMSCRDESLENLNRRKQELLNHFDAMISNVQTAWKNNFEEFGNKFAVLDQSLHQLQQLQRSPDDITAITALIANTEEMLSSQRDTIKCLKYENSNQRWEQFFELDVMEYKLPSLNKTGRKLFKKYTHIFLRSGEY